MKFFRNLGAEAIFFLALLAMASGQAQNQTPDFSPIYSEEGLPFRLHVELADFQLPVGLHSGAEARYNGKWIFIAGRTNGMHGFDSTFPITNFPPDKQNRTIYVVDPIKKIVKSRSLDNGSGLTEAQIEILSVTSPQCFQRGKFLYLTGGYGFDTSIGDYTTKDILTSINIPNLIRWVENPILSEMPKHTIRQISDPTFKVAGGYMSQIGKTVLLVFGQLFDGAYLSGQVTQVYTEQVRRFLIKDNGKFLGVEILDPIPATPDPNYRRRDLNVIPAIFKQGKRLQSPGLVALSGVFTDTPNPGVWTVPVLISGKGVPSMADPSLPTTFKQGLNQYVCSYIPLYSKETGDMYFVLLGGITVQYFNNGQLVTDNTLPFVNQIATLKMDPQHNFKQFIMSANFPFIPSPFVPVGDPLLFGTGAEFFKSDAIPAYGNNVLKLDSIERAAELRGGSVDIGYVVGGIVSSAQQASDGGSTASPFIFKVSLIPVKKHHDSTSSISSS